jgi:hypothetical protein
VVVEALAFVGVGIHVAYLYIISSRIKEGIKKTYLGLCLEPQLLSFIRLSLSFHCSSSSSCCSSYDRGGGRSVDIVVVVGVVVSVVERVGYGHSDQR